MPSSNDTLPSRTVAVLTTGESFASTPSLTSSLDSTFFAAFPASPAGASAISLTSSFVSASATLMPLLETNSVAGPLNCRNSLSPHTVLLSAVRNPYSSLVAVLYVSVVLITRKNCASGIHDVKLGTCSLNAELRKRNGRGGLRVTEYATTCDGCAVNSSPSPSVSLYTCPGADSAASPRPVRCVAPQCAAPRDRWRRGVGDRVWPVQARRALRWDTIQSVVPSRRRTEKVVVGDFVATRAVMGVVAEMRW